MDDTTAAAKARLRETLKAVRAAAHAEAPDAPARLRDHALAAIPWPAGAIVAGYWPLATEMDPRPLLEALAARGRPIALPCTGTGDAPLTFRLWPTLGEVGLIRGPFGLREPPETAPAVRPDVVLAPMLGFDRAGGRIGWGEGHYDRALARLSPRPLVIGIAYAAQEVAALPTDAHDQRLDWIVTEKGAYGVPS